MTSGELNPAARWAAVLAGLVVACPLAAYAAYFLGLAGSIGGVPGSVATEIVLVTAVATVIWRWHPARRNPQLRGLVVFAICTALALGGTYLVFVVTIFNDPAWNQL